MLFQLTARYIVGYDRSITLMNVELERLSTIASGLEIACPMFVARSVASNHTRKCVGHRLEIGWGVSIDRHGRI